MDMASLAGYSVADDASDVGGIVKMQSEYSDYNGSQFSNSVTDIIGDTSELDMYEPEPSVKKNPAAYNQNALKQKKTANIEAFDENEEENDSDEDKQRFDRGFEINQNIDAILSPDRRKTEQPHRLMTPAH